MTYVWIHVVHVLLDLKSGLLELDDFGIVGQRVCIMGTGDSLVVLAEGMKLSQRSLRM
jgi:hypothetical protein